jgi:hypothetical protein
MPLERADVVEFVDFERRARLGLAGGRLRYIRQSHRKKSETTRKITGNKKMNPMPNYGKKSQLKPVLCREAHPVAPTQASEM